MQLMELMVTCASEPEKCVGEELLRLEVERENVWEVLGVVDIMVRRCVSAHVNGRPYGQQALRNAIEYCVRLFWLFREERQLRNAFGIIVSGMTIAPEMIEHLASPLTSFLLELLK